MAGDDTRGWGKVGPGSRAMTAGMNAIASHDRRDTRWATAVVARVTLACAVMVWSGMRVSAADGRGAGGVGLPAAPAESPLPILLLRWFSRQLSDSGFEHGSLGYVETVDG